MAALLFVQLGLAAHPPERVAIVGGGLAGLGTSIRLLDRGVRVLHVYDAQHAPGLGGASAAAAGLLHPFTRHGKEIWLGREGFCATQDLIRRCESLGNRGVSDASGLFRLALTAEQETTLRGACQTRGDANEGPLEQKWMPRDALDPAMGVGDEVLGATYAPAALSVDTPAYLRALWDLCESVAHESGSECEWRARRLPSLAELHTVTATMGEPSYDAVIVASGYAATELAELRSLGGKALRPCRGQNLIFENAARLRTPLICGKYVVPVEDGRRLIAGATFEYDPPETADRPADVEAATAALRSTLVTIHPALAEAHVYGAQAGVRSLPPRSHHGYVPLAGRLALPATADQPAPCASAWLFGGLGSRGLIHHALLGAAVADAVLTGEITRIPEHMRRMELL